MIADQTGEFEENEYDVDINRINAEYEQCIQELLRRVQIAKEDRKKSEQNLKTLQHRVVLLQKQEKLAKQQFENTKQKLESILGNRPEQKFNVFYENSNSQVNNLQMKRNKSINIRPNTVNYSKNNTNSNNFNKSRVKIKN